MSDMTDAEFLRELVLCHDEERNRFDSMADRLDALDTKAPSIFGSTQSGRAEAYMVEGDVLAPGSRIGTTADGLPIYHADAMQWRDEPPDSEGWWAHLDFGASVFFVWEKEGKIVYNSNRGATSDFAILSGMWLKLPETPK